MKFHKLLTLITVLLFPMLSLAEKQGFIIKAIEKTPKFIINKQIIQTKYMVLNNTSSPLIHNRLIPFSSGIQQITTGKGTCQSTFDLEPGASCTLILEINAATMKNNTIQGGPQVCQTSAQSTHCSVISSQDEISIRRNEDIDAILNKPLYKNSTWGLQVIEQETGDLLINLRPHDNFYIGSIRKLFSIGELLNQLGADYKFHTPVNYQGTLDSKGVLTGNLILVASGDLTMGGRTLPDGTIALSDFDHNEANSLGNAILTKPDPLAGYKKLAKQVYDFGIRRINGNVIIDDRLFTPFNFRDEFNVSAIFVNDDVVDVTINPSSVGNFASVNWRPVSEAFTIQSHLKTTAAGTQETYKLSPELPGCIGKNPCQGQISGNIPINFLPPLTEKLPLVQTFRIVEPGNYARTVFIEALKQAGITVNAPVVAINPSPASGTSMPITSLISLPYSEYAKFILKVSYNIGADTSLVLFGLTQSVKNMADALFVEKNLLTSQYHLPAKEFYFIDGSGGGQTTATNFVVTKWLQIMSTLPVFQAYFDALPILGIDGSLATVTAFQKNPSLKGATGQVRAKTGTYAEGTSQGLILKGQGFAGYITTKSGRKLIYQLVVNNVPLQTIDEILNVFEDEGTLSAILWRDL